MTVTTTVDPGEVLSFVRRRRSENDPRRFSDRFADAYTKLFVAGYAVLVIVNLVGSDIAPRPGFFVDVVKWLPLLLLGVTWAILRFATWQGPVLFSAPEMQWVVSAPLERGDLVLVRLRRSLVIAAAAGAAGGLAIGGAAAVITGDPKLGVFLAAPLGMTALAVTATALSWHIERSVAWSARANRGATAVIALAVGIGWSIASGHTSLALWSGPWGWASAALVGESGGNAPGWGFAAVLLGLLTIVALMMATRTAGMFSAEELWRRAEARSAAAAAMFFGDVRTMRRVARQARTRGRVRGRAIRIPRANRPWAIVAYRDVVTFRRNPGLIGRAGLLAATSLAAALAAGDRPVLAIGAVIGVYLAASRLIEPIRFEAEQSDAHRILPWSFGQMLVMHCLVPTALLTALGWTASVIAVAGGFVEVGAVLPLVLATPFAAAAMITPAAASAARRPFPVEFLITQEERGWFALFGWLITGPVLAAVVADLGFGLLLRRLDQGIVGASGSIVVFTLATAAFTIYLWNKTPPD